MPGRERDKEMKDKPKHKVQRALGSRSSKCARRTDDVRTQHWLAGSAGSSQGQDHFPPSAQPEHYPFSFTEEAQKEIKTEICQVCGYWLP